jgi:gluconate 2-dehydrogenase subunit 3-like protein
VSAAASHEGRFPGFDALSETKRWDPVTAGVVMARLGPPPPVRSFTPAEQAVATALLARLLGETGEVPVLQMIDSRLAERQTDGWRYEDMPEDGQAWKDSLAALDADAVARYGRGFADCEAGRQDALIQKVQDLAAEDWHGMPAGHVWSLWTRYACTAFYSHPSAWNEIGFPGPAYPRGYKNLGVDALEPFEVRDAHPDADPLRKDE